MPAPRVRFAPAPTGWLHVGGARTALYNWLHARQGLGSFILRIEDTDAERVSSEALDAILEALTWLGLDWDEGPGHTEPYGPYRQSERMPLYASVAQALLEAGHAYDAYETPEELAAEREAAQLEGRPPGYSGAHRNLTQQQREQFIAQGRQAVVRIRTPDEGTIGFDDLVRGRVEVAWKDVPDFVIQRADGSPTYYLANTVDDLAMGINLVARGEDLLSATPRQLLLHELLVRDGLLDGALADNDFPARPPDVGAETPQFAHLPLLVGEDRKPLSKRHGDVAVDEFRRQGYLPEVMVNFLALCGWGYDATRERFTRDELVEAFSFDRVSRNPAYFDTAKLRALNGDSVKELGDEELAERLQPHFAEAGLLGQPPSPEHQRLLRALAPLLRERIQVLSEALGLVAFCFTDEVTYDERAVSKHLSSETATAVLEAAAQALADVSKWNSASIQAVLDAVAEGQGVSRSKAFQPVRVAVSGNAVSPPLPETLAVLDRDLVVRRLLEAAKRFGS